MGAKRKTSDSESQQNEGAQMSSELESDRAMVLNLEFKLLVLEAAPVVMPVTLSMGS